MSIAIKTPLLLPFNRTISNDKIERAITSDTKADAVALTLWDKIKDWFCGTKTSEVLERIFVLTHVDEKVNTEQALSAVLAFHQLRDMAYPIHFDKFRAAVTSNEEGQYTFSFSITDVMNERRVSYGTHQDDVNVIRRQLLTNAGEFLNSERVGDRQVGTALAEVTYDGGRKVFIGVSQANQNRLFLELLNDATKDAMAMRPKLAQEWLALQMKSFDYFARLRSSLETEANMAEIALEEVEESCILSFGRSIDALYKNRIEMLAVEFNEKCQDSVKQGVVSREKKVTFNPVTTRPAAVEPIYAEPLYAKPTDIKPAKAEPPYAEPADTKPSRAEPPYAEPVNTKPARAEPLYEEPTYTKPARAESPYAEPVNTKLSRAEPIYAEPTHTKPAKAEPPYAEPADTKPARAEPPYAEPVNSPFLYIKPALAASVVAKASSAKPVYDEPLYAEPIYNERYTSKLPHTGSPYDQRFEAIDKNTLRTREEENNNRINSATHLDDVRDQTVIQSAHYYHGPRNGDIYAKIEKTHSDLLEEIVSDVRMHEEKYPLLAEYLRKYNFL